eukprot:scaffold7021_cov120-Isochrysis_galbana.AAC.6
MQDEGDGNDEYGERERNRERRCCCRKYCEKTSSISDALAGECDMALSYPMANWPRLPFPPIPARTCTVPVPVPFPPARGPIIAYYLTRLYTQLWGWGVASG